MGGAADGVRALRCTPRAPGLGGCLQGLLTGVQGREEEPLVLMGRGSWVGFLGEEGGVRRFLLKAFRGSVGVPAGEGVQERHTPVTGGLQAEPEEDDEDELEEEEEETRSSTAARGSMSGGGGGAALPC